MSRRAAASTAAGRLSAPASSTRRCSAKAASITARRSGPAVASPPAPGALAGSLPGVPPGLLPGLLSGVLSGVLSGLLAGDADGRAGFTSAVYLMVTGRPNQDVLRGAVRRASETAARRRRM
jgi:hypothetical protein